MTERKPPGLSYESWIDKQIREAEQRGEFAQLPGVGKPLPHASVPYDEQWWIKKKMAQEGSTAILQPTLALRKEIEDVLAEAAGAPSERRVREILEPVNEKIAANLRMPPPGPPLGCPLIDIDEVVAQWRQARSKDGSRPQNGIGAGSSGGHREEPVPALPAEGRPPSGGRRWKLRILPSRRRG
ncbi:DUF1992 domain-containing protein [Streptomyces angustmyceticus]|uniref:DnaJ homologue subfamily C member 28 conserved domain-containing protein n=1 Tax=Streptomyces angustmyceticus TaxID=285578 RepID=A0A5J4LHZ3_9ACTN|nr:DUF1992 domain-containing protein [Streptomyces angustmyceticus]GES30278.1 hypothetical protein San01_27650 [Streptomyces angustmyceticus]